MRRAALILLALLSVPAIAAAQVDGALAEALAQSEALMAEEKFEEAIRVLKRAEKLPGDPPAEVLLNLAVCFNRLGNFVKSEKYARAALEIAEGPGAEAGAYFMLGLSLAGGEAVEAEAAFRKVLKLTDGGANMARFRLGEVLRVQGRSHEACQAFSSFLEVQPVGAEAAQARWAMTSMDCDSSAGSGASSDVWTEVTTEHFRFLGNDTRDRMVEIAMSAERLVTALGRLGPGVELLSREPIALYGFADRASFERYRLAGWDAGYFVPHQHGVFGAFETREETTRRVYQEVVLHLLGTRLPRLPLWFRQGMAELYSNLLVADGEARLGLPIESHVRSLLALPGELPVARVLMADAAQAVLIEQFDACSWALVHYLLVGDAESRGQLLTYLRLVAELERPGRAFQRAFDLTPARLGELVLSRVQEEPMPYVRFPADDLPASVDGVRQLSEIEETLALANLALHTSPDRLGSVLESLRSLAEAEPVSTVAWTALGEAEAASGGQEAAVAAWRKAVDLDGGEFKAHLLLGGALLDGAQTTAAEAASAQYDEAVSTLERAVALRPDSFPAMERLSFAYASQAEPPDRAVAAAAHAAALRPGRADLVFNQLLIHAKRREVDAVRELLWRLEALGADAAQVTGSREMLLQLTLQQARDLMRQDRLDDAVGLLAEVQARTTRDDLRLTARDWMNRARTVQEHNRFAERYNQAVVAYEADDWDGALTILDGLTAQARPGLQARLVESLRAEVEYWRD